MRATSARSERNSADRSAERPTARDDRDRRPDAPADRSAERADARRAEGRRAETGHADTRRPDTERQEITSPAPEGRASDEPATVNAGPKEGTPDAVAGDTTPRADEPAAEPSVDAAATSTAGTLAAAESKTDAGPVHSPREAPTGPDASDGVATATENPAQAVRALVRTDDAELLAQLEALLQTRMPSLGAGTATAPLAALGVQMQPGLMTAVMAQSLGGQPATVFTPGNAALQGGQRNAPSMGLFKAVAKQPQAGEGQAGDGRATMDFKAITAALANQASVPGSTGAGAVATQPGTLEGASTTGHPSTPAGAAATPGLGERAAQAARADAPAPSHGQPRANGPQFAERIGMTIARAAEAGVDRVSIRLNPRELGRIDVRMELGQDGRMNLSVTADRPDTLDQLQRNIRDLERSLNDAGFDTGDGDLNFSLRQQQSSNDQAGDGQGNRGHDDGDAHDDTAGDDAGDGMIITHQSDSHMVVDLYV